jgi:hypothetical protein
VSIRRYHILDVDVHVDVDVMGVDNPNTWKVRKSQNFNISSSQSRRLEDPHTHLHTIRKTCFLFFTKLVRFMFFYSVYSPRAHTCPLANIVEKLIHLLENLVARVSNTTLEEKLFLLSCLNIHPQRRHRKRQL